MLRFLEEDPDATAIFVYPTKVVQCIGSHLGNIDLLFYFFPGSGSRPESCTRTAALGVSGT